MASSLTVGDYVTLQRGTTYKGNLVGKPGPALLGLGSIRPGGGFRDGDFKTYGGDCPDKLMLYPGDLFVSLKGATKDGEMIGSVARVPSSVARGRLTQDTVKLRFRGSGRNAESFLYWILRTPQYRKYCSGRATGSAVVALSREDFLSFPVPSITGERMDAVELLEAVDRKIEVNRQSNHAIEAMARTIFKSWFVDCDPVRSKAEGRAPFGMNSNTAALFPDRLCPGPSGKVPQGWLPDRWGALATLEYGKSLQNYVGSEAEFPVYGTNGQIGWNSQPLCPRPGIIIGRKGAYRGVHFSRTPFYVIDTAFYLAPKGDLDIYWAYFEIQQTDINAMDSGSAIPSTSREDFYAIPVVVPPLPIMKAFGETASLLYRKIDANLAESATLAALRDLLLPKLISGKIRLKDAEKELAAI